MRQSAVSGQFYPASKPELINSIEQSFMSRFGPGKLPQNRPQRAGRVMGLVCPHAGYMYSGGAAAQAYSVLAEEGVPDTVVILGPNHYGLGAKVSLDTREAWSTPLGSVQCDEGLGMAILERSDYLKIDSLAHEREHSIEVQLPFLQYLDGNIRITPISIAHLQKMDAMALADDLGSAIAQACAGKNVVIIASSDLSHYENKTTAAAYDSAAIEHIISLDPIGLVDEVYDRDITMCGAIGTAVMLEACKRLGANTARKLIYYSSGDVTGDTDQVVGYAAVAVERW